MRKIRDAGSPRRSGGVGERHDEAEQEQHGDVVEVADVGRGEEQAGRREHREEHDQRIPLAPERARPQSEAGEDRDPEHQERAEAVRADARHPLQERSRERHRHPVAAGEEVVGTPVAGDRPGVVLEDHARAPRVPGRISRRGRQGRVGDEPPAEREQEDQREADDHPPRAQPARLGGDRRDGVFVGLRGSGERHDPPSAPSAGLRGPQDRGRPCGYRRPRASDAERSARSGRPPATRRVGGPVSRAPRGQPGRLPAGPRPLPACLPWRVTTSTASQVVMGTAATKPMLPTSVRTISVATISPLATVLADWSDNTKRMRSGIDAPA